ncbi:hypothetical protein WR25_02066 [Diploscapter pachys]|uniref:C2H2-type domain-containing protein n=1 Tax=Diploscapter pachys TaxID=2018661 RepID=A0A2A2LLJ8_9BILA|nr:hypothetical protein WR25_18218 [Diploscapter pachys]PAV86887.1 hypothetical protein WR25_02066 [Diploscapter pachys]
MDLFLGREPCIQNAFSLTLKSGRDSSEDGDNSERQRSERSDSPPYDTMHCLDSPTTEEDRRQSAGLRGELKRPDLKGSFRCSICAKIFCHSSSLSRHRMQAHFKNYKCTLCRKEITS